jgi:hypothetical protein
MADQIAHRTGHRIDADPARVVAELFVPGEEQPGSRSWAHAVLERILALTEAEVVVLAATVVDEFRGRHRDLMTAFSDNFAVVDQTLTGHRRLSVSAGC